MRRGRADRRQHVVGGHGPHDDAVALGELVQRPEQPRVLLGRGHHLVALRPVEAGADEPMPCVVDEVSATSLLGRAAPGPRPRARATRRPSRRSIAAFDRSAARAAASDLGRPSPRSPPAASGPSCRCSGAHPARTAARARSGKRHHRVHRVVVGQPHRAASRSATGRAATAATASPATRSSKPRTKRWSIRTSPDSSTQPRARSARTPADSRAGVQVAGQHHRRAAGELLEHEAGLLELLVVAVVGVDVGHRELAAGPAVPQPDELGDARLAAQPVRSFSSARRAETSSRSGPYSSALACPSTCVRTRSGSARPTAAPTAQRQRDVDERDVRAVAGRERHAHAGVLAQQSAAHTGTSCSSTTSGSSCVITAAISRSSLRRMWACAAAGRHVAAVGDVPGADQERRGHEARS